MKQSQLDFDIDLNFTFSRNLPTNCEQWIDQTIDRYQTLPYVYDLVNSIKHAYDNSNYQQQIEERVYFRTNLYNFTSRGAGHTTAVDYFLLNPDYTTAVVSPTLKMQRYFIDFGLNYQFAVLKDFSVGMHYDKLLSEGPGLPWAMINGSVLRKPIDLCLIDASYMIFDQHGNTEEVFDNIITPFDSLVKTYVFLQANI